MMRDVLLPNSPAVLNARTQLYMYDYILLLLYLCCTIAKTEDCMRAYRGRPVQSEFLRCTIRLMRGEGTAVLRHFK